MITATEIFAAQRAWEAADEMFQDSVGTIIGAVRWEDTDFDLHDYSFELLRCDDDLRLTLAQVMALMSMGFERCWLCHRDGRQTRYYAVNGAWGSDCMAGTLIVSRWEKLR